MTGYSWQDVSWGMYCVEDITVHGGAKMNFIFKS